MFEVFEESKGEVSFANEPLKVGDGLHEELLNYEFKDIELDKIISLKEILSQSKKLSPSLNNTMMSILAVS